VAQWSKGDPAILEESVAVIHKAASSILSKLEVPSADNQDEEQKGNSAVGAT
jgi:hypothetical protein